MNDCDFDTLSVAIYRLSTVVLIVALGGIWATIPRLSDDFSRSFRRLFGVLSLAMLHILLFRAGAYGSIGLPVTVQLVIGNVAFLWAIYAAFRAMRAARHAHHRVAKEERG